MMKRLVQVIVGGVTLVALNATVLLGVYAVPVQAEGLSQKLRSQYDVIAQQSYGNKAGATDLEKVIGGLIQAALMLTGAILLGIMLYAGYLWMTAGGDDKKVTKARDWIKNAIIGLVILVAANAITSYVLMLLTGAATGGSK